MGNEKNYIKWLRNKVGHEKIILNFAGGCIFNFLNEKCGNIYPSWLVHLCANLAINTVGFILFGIL